MYRLTDIFIEQEQFEQSIKHLPREERLRLRQQRQRRQPRRNRLMAHFRSRAEPTQSQYSMGAAVAFGLGLTAISGEIAVTTFLSFTAGMGLILLIGAVDSGRLPRWIRKRLHVRVKCPICRQRHRFATSKIRQTTRGAPAPKCVRCAASLKLPIQQTKVALKEKIRLEHLERVRAQAEAYNKALTETLREDAQRTLKPAPVEQGARS